MKKKGDCEEMLFFKSSGSGTCVTRSSRYISLHAQPPGDPITFFQGPDLTSEKKNDFFRSQIEIIQF